jgi:hypothetical protein
VIRVGWRLVLGLVASLVDDHADKIEGRGLDQRGQFVQKRILQGRRFQERKIAEVLADVTLMQDNLVVLEMFELELLQCRRDLADVVALLDDEECKHEQWILRINIAHAGRAALVRENHVAGEGGCHAGAADAGSRSWPEIRRGRRVSRRAARVWACSAL